MRIAVLLFFLSYTWTYQGGLCQDLRTDVPRMFLLLNVQYKIVDECIETAKEKMADEQFANYDPDEKYAVALINLYTQPCDIQTDVEYFYSRLNKELREGNPAPFWKNTGRLVNLAVDKLGKTRHSVVYRGQGHLDNVPKEGDTFSFKQMVSTSTDPIVPLDTFCDGFFFTIHDVEGLYATRYSYYEDAEEEVLLKSTTEFTVTKVSTDIKANKATIDEISKTTNYPAPKTYIELKYIWPNVNGRRKRSGRSRNATNKSERSGGSRSTAEQKLKTSRKKCCRRKAHRSPRDRLSYWCGL